MSDLYLEETGYTQAREFCMRNGIASDLFMRAAEQARREDLRSIYVIDTITDKGARIDHNPYSLMFGVKVSSRTGTELLEDLSETYPALLDILVIID